MSISEPVRPPAPPPGRIVYAPPACSRRPGSADSKAGRDRCSFTAPVTHPGARRLRQSGIVVSAPRWGREILRRPVTRANLQAAPDADSPGPPRGVGGAPLGSAQHRWGIHPRQ